MSVMVRRNLVFVWLAVLTGALALTVRGQAASEHKITDFDEINVHRINIIEPDGKPRVIISNRARIPGIYWAGKEYPHPNRDEGGVLFFNDEGTEVGGLSFTNRHQGDGDTAHSSLQFDQFHQDQTLGLVYSDINGKRSAGMQVWDRPNGSILPMLDLVGKYSKATTEAERTQLKAQAEQVTKSMGDPPAAERFFAGKVLDDSVVKLNDKQGRPRLLLKVDGAGSASVEFLDAAGKVVKRISDQEKDR